LSIVYGRELIGMKVLNAAVSVGTISFLSLVVLLFIPAPCSCDAYEDSLTTLLPASGEVEGWERDGEHFFYYADDLWEYINGAAEGFLAYDVKAVIAQDFLDESGTGLKLEIYDHRTPLMGFGIYSQHRDASFEFLAIGGEAFGDEYSLYFWKDRYFVKINVYAENGNAAESMKLFARIMDGKIIGSTSRPMEIEAFPTDGLIPHSVAFLTEGVLGRGRFPHAFVADYLIGEDEGQLYLFPTGGDEEAEGLFTWYGGEIAAEISRRTAGEASYEGGEGTDPYQGDVAIFRIGSWLGIVTGFEEARDAARGLVERCVMRITAMSE
jgi:hypothetical protein